MLFAYAHGRRPFGHAKPPPGLGIAKPRVDAGQVCARELAQSHRRSGHVDMIACRYRIVGNRVKLASRAISAPSAREMTNVPSCALVHCSAAPRSAKKWT